MAVFFLCILQSDLTPLDFRIFYLVFQPFTWRTWEHAVVIAVSRVLSRPSAQAFTLVAFRTHKYMPSSSMEYCLGTVIVITLTRFFYLDAAFFKSVCLVRLSHDFWARFLLLKVHASLWIALGTLYSPCLVDPAWEHWCLMTSSLLIFLLFFKFFWATPNGGNAFRSGSDWRGSSNLPLLVWRFPLVPVIRNVLVTHACRLLLS